VPKEKDNARREGGTGRGRGRGMSRAFSLSPGNTKKKRLAYLGRARSLPLCGGGMTARYKEESVA